MSARRPLLVLLGLTTLAAGDPPTREETAKAIAGKVATALESFILDYNNLPVVNPTRQDALVRNAEVMYVIRAIPKGVNAGDLLNSRRIKYLDDAGLSFKDDELLDPWGRPYLIMLDFNDDQEMMVGEEKVASIVAVWSCGPNGIDEKGRGDDLVSWKRVAGKSR